MVSLKINLLDRFLYIISMVLFLVAPVYLVDLTIWILCPPFNMYGYDDYYFTKLLFKVILTFNPFLLLPLIVYFFYMLSEPTKTSRSRKRSKYHQQKVDRSYKPKECIFFSSSWKTALLDDCKCSYRSYKFVYDKMVRKLICPVCGLIQEGV